MCRSLTLVILLILPTLFAMDFVFLEVMLDRYQSFTFDGIEETKCSDACNPFFEVRVRNATYRFGGDTIGYKGKNKVIFRKYLSPTLRNKLVFQGDYENLVLPKPQIYFTIGNDQGGERINALVNEPGCALAFPRLHAFRLEDKWSLGFVTTENLALYFRYQVYCTEESKGRRCGYLSSALSFISSKCVFLLVCCMLLTCFPTMFHIV